MAILKVTFPHDGLLVGEHIEVSDERVAEFLKPDYRTNIVKFVVASVPAAEKAPEKPLAAPAIEQAPVAEPPVEEKPEEAPAETPKVEAAPKKKK